MENPVDGQGWIAGVLAFVSGGALVWWRSYLRIRADLRGDHAAEREKRVTDQIHETYAGVIKDLRDEIDRLTEIIQRVSTEFSQERSARREAEERAINAERRAQDLEARVDALERQLAQMKIER